MTNSEIESQLHRLVQQERKITSKILNLINLAEERKLPLHQGYPSTLDWLAKKFGYSERAAYRRISAARLLRAVPEVAEKIETGEVNLTTLAQVQSVVRAQERATGEKVSALHKAEIVYQIQNRTAAEAEKELISFFPEAALSVQRDHVRSVDADTSRMAVNLSNETLEKLKRAKELLSHVFPNGSWAEIIDRIADEFLNRKDPLKKSDTKKVGTLTQNRSGAHAQSVGAADRRQAFQLTDGGCEYRDPVSGRVCGSRYQVEIDHIRPRALGGGNERENLRVLCRKHNQLMAEKNLGTEIANGWREKLKVTH